MTAARVRRRREERGAAAVEAALIASLLLAPLFSGVLYWGHFFWESQKVRTLDVTAIPQGSVAGTYTLRPAHRQGQDPGGQQPRARWPASSGWPRTRSR